MKELKEGAISRIKAVLSVYKPKNLAHEEKLIIKEFETALSLLGDGYEKHILNKTIRFLVAVLIGFMISVLTHHVFL